MPALMGGTLGSSQSGGMSAMTGGLNAAECPDGTWDHDGDPTTECLPWTDCAEGARVDHAGSSVRDRDCEPCPEGSYSNRDNAEQCVDHGVCGPGAYVEMAGTGTADTVCQECPSGTFSSDENADACLPHRNCLEGERELVLPSATTDRVCTPCPAGTFPSADGSACDEEVNCPAGTSLAPDGVTCTPDLSCPEGMFPAADGTACVADADCSPGTFVASPATESSPRRCDPCAAGTYSASENAATCTPWSAACVAGTVETVAPSATGDRVCEPEVPAGACDISNPCAADGDSSAQCMNTAVGHTCVCSGATHFAHAGRCLPLLSHCSALHAFDPALKSGTYTIDVDDLRPLPAIQAYCDMEGEGGGWTLVANYVHRGGSDPAPEALTERLPLLGPGVLGDAEEGTPYWGHASNALMAVIAADELRFYGESSGHARVLHVASTSAECVRHLERGRVGCASLSATFTALTGHTAQLPAVATGAWTNTLDGAFCEYPFVTSSAAWAISANGNEWAMDDRPGDASLDTIHRLFVRHTLTPSP